MQFSLITKNSLKKPHQCALYCKVEIYKIRDKSQTIRQSSICEQPMDFKFISGFNTEVKLI